VSSQNLESIIHQFQENYTGGDSSGLPPGDQLSSSRKRFTALLGRTLQDRLGHLSQSQQLKLAKNAFDDLSTKDIQVYAKDASTAQFLRDQHLDHALQRGSADGVAVVDTNLSGKQNTFVQESLAESVVLTSSGVAQHTLTITYQFVNPHHEPTYGYFPGYRDYLRVYIPPQSTNWHSSVATITHLTSDEPQRAMWGGFVVVQENGSPVKITLQWQVPAGATSKQPFTTFVQSQAGNHAQLQVTITKAGENKPALHYATSANAIFDQDRTFSVH
jgi:hypothetical protein